MGLKFKKFNAVNDSLPQDLDNNLQAFAQETGQISYTDIMNFKGDAEKYRKLRYHLNKWNEYIESGQDDKALKKSDDIRAMIKGQKDFGFGKKTWHIFALDIEGGAEEEVGTGDYTSRDEAEAAWNEIANENDQKYSNPKFKCYSKKHTIDLKKFSTPTIRVAHIKLKDGMKSRLSRNPLSFKEGEWTDLRGVDRGELNKEILDNYNINYNDIDEIFDIKFTTEPLDEKGFSIYDSEKAAIVLKNADGTHEVISIQDESDEERVQSYVKDEGAKVIKRCRNTKEADEYIESRKLKRAYSGSEYEKVYFVIDKKTGEFPFHVAFESRADAEDDASTMDVMKVVEGKLIKKRVINYK